MTIRTSLFIFSVLTATAWLGVSSVADAAPLNPIPSPETATHGGATIVGQVIVENNAACQECAEPSGSFDFLHDNIITRAYHSMAKDFKRNNCWPRPFVWDDRQATRAPFVVMVNKGWQRENTLGEYHFDRASGKLNEPGRLRTHWIVTQEIPQRRSIFVHRAMQPEMTLARVDSVQQWVAQIVPHGDLPPVIETNIPAPGRPAEEVDHIRIEYLKSMPPPRLPANESMDTGYSGQ